MYPDGIGSPLKFNIITYAKIFSQGSKEETLCTTAGLRVECRRCGDSAAGSFVCLRLAQTLHPLTQAFNTAPLGRFRNCFLSPDQLLIQLENL